MACVFYLTQSPELCPRLEQSGASDFALEALAHHPDVESDLQLVQLAIVAHMAREPRFCRRLATSGRIDLLMHLAEDKITEGCIERIHDARPSEQRIMVSENSGDDQGSSGSSSQRDSVVGNEFQHGAHEVTSVPRTPRARKLSGNSVRVASPLKSSLRFCVVGIAESLGRLTESNGEEATTLTHVTLMPVRG